MRRGIFGVGSPQGHATSAHRGLRLLIVTALFTPLAVMGVAHAARPAYQIVAAGRAGVLSGAPSLRERFATGETLAYTYMVTSTTTLKSRAPIPPNVTVDRMRLRYRITRILPSGAGCGDMLLRHLTSDGWRNRGYPDVARGVCLAPTGGMAPPFKLDDDIGYLCDPQSTVDALPGGAASVGRSWRGAASLSCTGYRGVAPASLPMTFRVVSIQTTRGQTLVRIVGDGALARTGRALTDDINHIYNPSSITVRLHTDDTFDATQGRWVAYHVTLDGSDVLRSPNDQEIWNDSTLHIVMNGSPAASGPILPDPGDVLPWVTVSLLLASATMAGFLLWTGGLTPPTYQYSESRVRHLYRR